MSGQTSLFEPPRPAPRLPEGDVQIRKTSRKHVCVVCGNPVLIGNRAEVWPGGTAHVECGIKERQVRK